jgi:LPXTG-motif cell wall-anchored protein
VRGVALEQEQSTLPLTGATIGVLAAVGLGVLVVGGVLLKTGRRRVDTE